MKMGELIQKKRGEAGLSQEGLAELVGVSRQAVSKWEVGDAVPDTDKLLPLARALGLSVDELLGNRPEGESPAQSGAGPREGTGSGALAERWYWLGLIPVAWGLYRSWAAVFSFWQVMKLFRHVETLQNMGLPIDIWTKPDGMMGRYVTSGGQLDLSPAVWMLLGWLAVSLAAAVLGLLIIFLGRRHVRKKRG